MKLMNNYIAESVNNINFRKVYGKYNMGVAFTQTQQKDEKDNKNTNIKWESHCLHCLKKDYWEAECPDLEE